MRRAIVVITSALLLFVQPVSASGFDIHTELDEAERLSLTVPDSPDAEDVAKEVMLNWTIRLDVVEWTEEWYEDDPSFTIKVSEPNTNFSEHHSISFTVNRTESKGSFFMIFYGIGPHSMFTSYDLGNLSDIDRLTFYPCLTFNESMPDRDYAVTFSTYDPFEEETTSESTTTTAWDENALLESLRRNSIVAIAAGFGILSVIAIYLKKR